MMSKVFLLFLGLLSVVECGPLHASCKLDWTFTMACNDVENKLMQQIKEWTGLDNCGTGEKCGYEFVSASSTVLKAKHMTPVKKYVDDLDFSFSQDGKTCKVHGHSTSETWYAILDYSTNYCNLRNLVDGSGLSKEPGFNEVTSDSICTQYSSHNCEKY